MTIDAAMLKRLAGALCLLASSISCFAVDTKPDSARMLREVEVLGVKQMPDAGILPVSEFGRAEINRLNIKSVQNLGDLVPNLYTPAYGSKMTASIYMRGLGSRIDQPVVGLSIDGVPVLNKDAYDTELPFINKIEVLRGAQSVLNGRNAMAGQINIYTLSPLHTQGIRFLAQYGRNNSIQLSGGLYEQISEKLFSSISLQYIHTDGFWKNTFNNSPAGQENNASIRWKTVFRPKLAHTITNTLAFSCARQKGYPYESVASGRIAYNDTCFYRRNYLSDGLIVAWAGKRVVVNSISSVQYLDDNMTLDQDFTPLDYFTLTQRRKEVTLTEDLFAKGSRGNYSWLGGVFGFWRRTRMDAPVTFLNTGIERLIEEKRNEMNPQYPISWDDRNLLLGSCFTTPSHGIALYHQSTLRIGAWVVDAGIRVENEKISCSYTSDADASFTTWHNGEVFSHTPVNIHDKGKMSQSFTQVLPRITVSRDFGPAEAYISFTKGYKSGGFNSQMFSDVLQQRLMSTMGIAMAYTPEDIVRYKPETSWNSEIGISASDPDHTLSARLTAFLIMCRNQQLTIFPPGTVTGRIMTNAGRTLSRGVELTGEWIPSSDFSIKWAYGFTDARFRRYNNGRADFRGKRVPYAPSNTLWLQGLWMLPWHPSSLSFSLDCHLRGTGSIMWNEENTLRQPFYLIPGASASVAWGKWAVKLWGENLSSTRYDTFSFTSIGNRFVQRGNPLTWGVTLNLSI